MAPAVASREPGGALRIRLATLRALSRSGGCTPHPRPAPHETDAPPRSRGALDALALRLRHSDAALYARTAPAGGRARDLFDLLEQARVESLGVRDYPGMRTNLRGIEPRSAAGLGDRELRAARARFGAPLALLDGLAAPGDGASDEQAELTPAVRDCLEALTARVADQAAFAAESLRLVDLLEARSGAASPLLPTAARTGEAPVDQGAAPQRASARGASGAAAAGETLTSAESVSVAGPAAGPMRAGDSLPPGYRAFTRSFDRVWDVLDSAAPLLPTSIDPQTERRFRAAKRDFARWALRLQRHLLGRRRWGWDRDREDGVLDETRLTRVVIDPLRPPPLKHRRRRDAARSAVTLLIDCSGSMRGSSIAAAAAAAQLLSLVFERCGVSVELLGFTTARWRGGRSREAWLAAGRPVRPGRIGDLLHIVFKPPHVPWRRAKRSLAVMLDEDLLKENVDGEALAWACERLRRRAGSRHLLLVISDGAPRDESTLAANDPGYLDRHLRSVIGRIEASPVHLIAIGIDHDVAAHYSRAFTVTGPENLGEAIVTQLIRWLDDGGRRTARRPRGR